ncbi:MAG: RecX family transcriptional regulator [Muribaculaceae bacterium]|nr:RecX family transcriptional regulator [Muribaculaceae bacterium]
MIRKTLSPDAALQRAEDLCARSEQCTSEIQAKLYTWGIGTSDSAKIIARLKQSRYIDDARYARAFVRDKIQFARWGRRKITAALTAKRIDHDTIAAAIADEASDTDLYMTNLLAALRSKARSLDMPLTRDDRDRLIRFAASRGYEPQLILKAIRNICSSDEDSMVD